MLIFFSIKWVKFRLLWHSTNKNVLYFRLTIISCKNKTTQDVGHVHNSALFISAQTRGRKYIHYEHGQEKSKGGLVHFPLIHFGLVWTVSDFDHPLHHRHYVGRFFILTFPWSSTKQRNVTSLLLGSVIYANCLFIWDFSLLS